VIDSKPNSSSKKLTQLSKVVRKKIGTVKSQIVKFYENRFKIKCF